MDAFINSLLAQTTPTDQSLECLEYILDKQNEPLLSSIELRVLSFVRDSYQSSQTLPTSSFIVQRFPEYSQLQNARLFSPNDLVVHFHEVVDLRTKRLLSTQATEIAQKIVQQGFTDDLKDQMDALYLVGKETTENPDLTPQDLRSIYDLKSSQPKGLVLGIKAIDDLIGGLTKGTVNTIFGWTGSYKSTIANNIAYRNTYLHGYNGVIISLEVPKADIEWNLASRHSFESMFPKYQYIPHEKIRQCKLTPDEAKYVFDSIIPDLKNNSKGKLVILDETDFKTLSKAEIKRKILEVDDKMDNKLDFVIVDHVGLLKFAPNSSHRSEGEVINEYVSFFRQMGISFRRDKESKRMRELCMIILVQANREGWKRAVKNQGRYDLRAISEANEVERASYRIFSIFNDESLKESKEAKMQVLKNRSGATLMDPVSFFVDPVCYTAGDDLKGFNEAPSTADLDNLFDADINDFLV